jgi:hypothetical protein
MAIIQELITDKIEVVTDFKHIQVRQAKCTLEEGIEVAPRSFHRFVLTPEMDISDQPEEIKDIANAVWTDEVKSAWAAKIA